MKEFCTNFPDAGKCGLVPRRPPEKNLQLDGIQNGRQQATPQMLLREDQEQNKPL